MHPGEIAPAGAGRGRREVILVVGRTGAGKSLFVKRHLLPAIPRVIIVDPMNEYAAPGFDRVEHLVRYISSQKNLWQARFVGGTQEDFERVCRVAYLSGRCTLLVEEAQRFMPSRAKRIPESLGDVAFRGRHREVSLVMVAQRASAINIDIRSQWSKIVTFRQTEPADTKWLREQAPITEGEILPLPALEELPTLHGYLCTPSKTSKLIVDKA